MSTLGQCPLLSAGYGYRCDRLREGFVIKVFRLDLITVIMRCFFHSMTEAFICDMWPSPAHRYCGQCRCISYSCVTVLRMEVVLLSADLATMLDSFAHNAGFIVVRPTRYSRAVYERVKHITGISGKTDDQSALNTAIQFMNRMHKRHGFKAAMLDRKKYTNDLSS